MKKWNLYTTNEIKPKGWLYRQLKLQAEGLSGNLDKVWPDVRDSAWVGGDREGWERVPYWLDGFIPLAYLLEDEDMIGRARKYIDAIIERQQADGWICPCAEEEREKYDTWAIQLITKVLTVYYECSRDERIPEVIYKTLKNYYELLKAEKVSVFGWAKYRWFELFIALDFIDKRYNEPWVRELAEIMKAQGGDYASYTERWVRPLNKWTFETHIVNLGMMLKYEAVSCDILGMPYTDVAEKLYGILNKYNGTAVETFTGDECLSGVSPIQGTELCAVVEQMYSYELLYAYTGDSKWADRLEVLAFNALPATISEDMWTHQYVQMNNQIACEKFGGKPIFRTNGKEAHLFGLEPNFGCCTANFNQGWPKLALCAFMHNGDSIINALPVPSELRCDKADILLETSYPFENTLKYTVSAKKPFKLSVRLPKDAGNITVDGHACERLEFDFEGADERVIEIAFELRPEFKSYAYGLGYVKQGSLVFALPIEYEKVMHEYEAKGVVRKYPYCDYELVPKSDWSYGFADKTLKATCHGVGDVPFSQSEPPVSITASMHKIDWGYEEGYETVCAKVPESTEPISEALDMTLIPYGCTRLRMTLLPLSE